MPTNREYPLTPYIRIDMVLAIISKTAINKNTRLYIIGCKIGCLICKTLIFNVYCGAYGTRTRDPMRDRHVF